MSAHGPALYDAVIVHRRQRPVVHELRYRLTYALFDLDDLEALSARSRLFSYNRFNLFSLRDRDHGPRDGTPIRRHVDRIVAKAGLDGQIGAVKLLCLPRFGGYVFNPLSIYYAYGTDERLRLVLYEVSNTFGEQKTYVLPVEPAEPRPLRQSCAKRFYVSPFNDISGRYDFRINQPGDRVRVGISLADQGGPVLDAHLVGARREFNDRELARTAVRHPALTWKVFAGIHWEALKLFGKGLRTTPRPPAPDAPVSYLPTAFEPDHSAR